MRVSAGLTIALLVALPGHLGGAGDRTEQAEKLKRLQALAQAVLKKSPTSALFEVKGEELRGGVERKEILDLVEREEGLYLVVAQAIKRDFPELGRVWGPPLHALEVNIREQLKLTRTPANARAHRKADKENEATVNQALANVAKARGVEFTDEEWQTLLLREGPLEHAVRIEAVPAGARVYYSSVLKRELMEDLRTPEKAWSEVLTKTAKLGGNYYFRAEWPDGFKKVFGPTKVKSSDPILLSR
jgi:hypothetical protein